MSVYGIDGELVISPFFKSKVDKFSSPVNIRAFYLDLHNAFSKNKAVPFKDTIGDPNDKKNGNFFDYAVKAGEQVDNGAYFNRTGSIYEKKFTWNKNGDSMEFEMLWEAWVPGFYSKYGWIEIKIDLVNRMMKDKEFLVGNEKVIMQTGTWEFRNTMTYKNKVISEYVKKIPFLGKNPSFQHFYVEHFYNSTLENDIIEFSVKKIRTIVLSTIEKHFQN